MFGIRASFLILLFLGIINACQPKQAEPAGKTPPAAPSGPAFTTFEQFSDFEPLLRQRNDTTYVVNFWATWCAPCVAEMPYFETLHERVQGEKIKVVLVSLDFKKDVESKFIPFLQKRQLKPEVVLLLDGRYNDWIDRVSPEWSGAIPATYVYKGGKSQFYGEQFSSYEELEQLVRSL